MSISKESISNAAMADCILPTDVMLSILTRLPAKSIQRFKFVSKLWWQLFSTPEFIKMYKGQFSIDPNNQSVIIFENHRIMYEKWAVNLINMDSNENPKKPSILDLPLAEISANMMILVGCCNGLICVVVEEMDFTFLWNPAMEMFQHVRLSGKGYKDDENFVSIGLGYDDGEDDFKLVRIVSEFDHEFDHNAAYFVEVYSVNSDVWTTIDTIDVNLSFGVNEGGYSVVTVNGNPYWLAAHYNYDEVVLVYFDVKLWAFRTVPLPPPYLQLHPYVGKGFVDWNGTLGYLECAHNKEKTESYAKVWVFEDSWICEETHAKRWMIEGGWRCIEILGPVKGIFDSFVMCSRNGNILGYQDRKCFLYDRQSNCVEEIMTMGHDSFSICGYTANFERTLKKSLPQILNAC